jgi:hypothetical protein
VTRPRRGTRSPCTGGCGRIVQDREGLCQPCQSGRPPPEPDPRLLTEQYLHRCVQELARRLEASQTLLARLRGEPIPDPVRPLGRPL